MAEKERHSFLWYASYGSNLLRARFLARIRGKPFPGARIREEPFPGARIREEPLPGAGKQRTSSEDPTPADRYKGVLILHRLMFAGASDLWDAGGVAFVQEEMDPEAKTLGRMYLISRSQFEDVLLKENRLSESDGDLQLNLEEIKVRGSSRITEGPYDTVLYLGEDDGYPIFTFTASWSDGPAPIQPPGVRYLGVMVQGLRETYRLSDEGIVEYLREIPGIQGTLLEGDLARIVREAADPYPNSFT